MVRKMNCEQAEYSNIFHESIYDIEKTINDTLYICDIVTWVDFTASYKCTYCQNCDEFCGM